MNATLQWFAIQAKPACEPVAELALRAMELETLLPLVRKPAWSVRRPRIKVLKPLFPGYLFVRFSPERSLRAVAYARGVIRIVGAGAQPLPVDDAIVASIRARLDSGGCVQLGERALRAGDAVRITEGPLWGWSGVFERELSDASRVAILIDTLQQQCRVVVRREALVPVGVN